MSAEYSVDEVLESARKAAASNGRAKDASMLFAYAERIKADEGAVPVGHFIQTSPGNWEQAAAMYAGQPGVIPLFPRPPAQAAQVDALPDPLGCNDCTPPDCGRYNGPRSVECRAMLNNACARPTGNQPYHAPTAEPAAQGEAVFPMTERQVIEWIDACNHEPCRQVLRDYLRLRDTRPHSPDAADSDLVTELREEAKLHHGSNTGDETRDLLLRAATALAAQGQGEHIGYLVDGTDFYYPDFPQSEFAKHKSVMPIYTHPAPAASPAGVPDGMVLVPRKATKEMLEVPASIVSAYAASRIWEKMIEAAPSAPEGGEVGL